MNPFDWTGPPFLLFYAVFSIVLCFGMHYFRKLMEGGDSPAFDTSDPYLIAVLRAGGNEAVRVAAVSLIDRKLLAAEAGGKVSVQKKAMHNARKGIEHAVIGYFAKSTDPGGLFKDLEISGLTNEYEQRLRNMGALPSSEQRLMRFLVLLAALAILCAVGVTKINIAIERGHSNYGFLILFMVVASIVAVKLAFPRLTALGSSMVQDLQTLFARLKPDKKSRTHSSATEVSLIAAVFGMAALPAIAYPFVAQVFPRATSSSSNSSCGSSSSSDSGGSSCSGGCGGGCGGCGGGD